MKKRLMGRWLSIVLVLSLLVAGTDTSAVSAAKAPRLSTSSVKVQVGQTKKVTVKNKPSGAKVTWLSANKKTATVKNGKIKGIAAGKTTVTAKVVYKKAKKKVTKSLKVRVTVTAATAVETKAPVTAVETQAPVTEASSVPAAQTEVPSVPSEQPAAQTEAPDTQETSDPEGLLSSNLGEEHLSANGITTKDNGRVRKTASALDITKLMGLGWNVGNSLEQVSAGSLESLSDEEKALLTDEDWVKGYETNAGNVQATQKLMDGLKAYGINTIRIPIAWSNMMTEETQADGSIFYKINDAYFNRVEEIMNYCLNDEMYVIINIHWDNGWWGMFGDADESVRAQAQKRYEDFWTQIAERYKEYSDNVIFEGANEELGERLNDDWKGGSSQFSFTSCTPGQGGYGVLTKEECYAKVKELNQKFVDIVRSSGGNNADRFLLIPGFNTNIHDTCSDDFSMPQDLEQNGTNKLFVSIHYYDPIGWGIAKSASQGYDGYADTWGSDEDYQYMWDDFAEAKAAFIDKGYGIIFGEFGVLSVNKDGVPDYFEEFFENCLEYGMVPVMWDEGTYVDRKGTGNKGVSYFVYEDIGNVFCEVTDSTVTLRSDAQKNLTNTGIPQSLISSNQDPLVVATWEGDFMRNTGAGELQQNAVFANYENPEEYWPSDRNYGGIFRTTSIDINKAYEGLTLAVTCAKEFWHEHFELSDWSALERPSVRITVHDDEISKTAQLQLVYSDGDPEQGAAWRYETDCEQVEWEDSVAEDGTTTQVAKKDENGDYVLADSAWIGKTLELNTEYLERYPVVLLTTNTYMGVDFVKVEICDAAYNSDGTEFEETAE